MISGSLTTSDTLTIEWSWECWKEDRNGKTKLCQAQDKWRRCW